MFRWENRSGKTFDALHQVKKQIPLQKKHYKQVAQTAFNLKMREACAGRMEDPKIRTFDGREHSTNSVNQILWRLINGTNDALIFCLLYCFFFLPFREIKSWQVQFDSV